MLEWSINVIKQLDISSKFMALALDDVFSGSGSSKTSSKSNLEEQLSGVDGVAGSHDVALTTDDSENLRRDRLVAADDL